jgi:UV DNA damage endonuclease
MSVDSFLSKYSPTTNPEIRLGLCCLNISLKENKPPIYPSRTIILKKVVELGFEEIQRRAILNLKDLIYMIHWNEKHRIKVFRLTSEIFPHHSNPKLTELIGIEVPYSIDFAQEYLDEISRLIHKYGHRVTFHPGQYNQLATENPDTLDKTVKELTAHAMVFEALKVNLDSVMVLHGGGMFVKKGEDPSIAKTRTLRRWVERFKRLPEFVRKRIVLENCEKCYSPDDLLPICLEYNIPFVFDVHHYNCYIQLHPEEYIRPLREILIDTCKTWGSRRMKIHISEQGEGLVGHHSDYISEIPQILIKLSKIRPFDLMIEAKMKELAIFKLYEKYPEYIPKHRSLVPAEDE